MALKTKRAVCQEILYEVYGGMPPSDARITERFVLTKLNDQQATHTLLNAYNNSNLEGITYADDIFYVTYNQIPLVDDAMTGYRTATLPALPSSLPSQRAFDIIPTSPVCDAQRTMIKMMERHEVQRMHSLPPVKKVFGFVNNGKIYFYINPKMFPLLELNSINLTIATPDGGMDSFLNMPADAVASAKKNIIADLRNSLMIPQDIKNDGVEIKEPQA